MTTLVSKLAVAAALLLGATSAFAADAPSVSVRYDDLNLSTDAGVSALYHRLAVAARQVCPNVYSRELNVSMAGERCQADAIAKAVSQVNNSHLAMLHAAHVSHG